MSITAKDRELTASGIRAVRPGLTSFEALLDSALDVLGFPDRKALEVGEKEAEVMALLKQSGGLLFVDNLETVDDARIVNFLDRIPPGAKALITSRRTTVRRLVSPIDIGGLNDSELVNYVKEPQRYGAAAHRRRL